MDENKEKEIRKFLTYSGVYGKLPDINEFDFKDLYEWDKCDSLDLCCPNCKADKTFVRQNHSSLSWFDTFIVKYPNRKLEENRLLFLYYRCPTCRKQLFFALLFANNSIIKLAQYPSLYDMSRDDLKQYKNNDLIDKESFDQIYKADICASSGYFVAAFTYMRRVYEALMVSVFEQNKDEIGISLEEFKKLGGHEKIEKIRQYLAIDEHIYGPLYSILSGGVHTATEDECSDDYNFLKLVLLDVLREQKSKKEREANRKAILDLHSKKKAEGK